ncbi:MAG: TIGR03936 family radical SAM-associated protein [Dehalococcoidia bacterium]
MPFQRLRVTYRNSLSSERPLGNLGRTWHDAFEAAGLRLARPEGSKRARIETGPPLPQDTTGEAELVDAVLAAPADPQVVVTRLSATLPDGLEPCHAEEIGERLPSLGASVRAARYRATFEGPLQPHDLAARVSALLALQTLDWEEQRGERIRRFDLRPLVYDLRVSSTAGGAAVEMRLALSQERSVRPASVLAALGVADCGAVLSRTAIEVDRPLVAIRAWRERGRFE